MAAALFLGAILLARLLPGFSVQHVGTSEIYDYGDNFDQAWCPFGTRGWCQCENDIIDCANRGLSFMPQSLPATIKQLILKDNQISSIEFISFATFTSLELLDLSSNNLHSIPENIFNNLYSLKEINLSNNPWVCDCNLKWLSVWIQSVLVRGIKILDEPLTSCVDWPNLSILDISPSDFLPCAAPGRVLRSSVPSSPQPIIIFTNWTSVCFYWFPQADCSTGPSKAGSCVLSPETHGVALVTYSFFTTQTNVGTCRDYCFVNNFTYYAFQNSTFHCLCGEEEGTVNCFDCSSSTLSSTALTLCTGSYMRIPQASHILSEVTLAFSSPLVTHIPVTFIVSGLPNIVTQLIWSFGDGSKQESASISTVSHTYFYPGLFPLRVDLCGSGVCQSVKLQVKVNPETVQADLTCPTFSEASGLIIVNITLSNSFASEVKWSRIGADGTVNARSCENGWDLFEDRCIRHVIQNKTFSQAELVCENRGGTLFKLNHLEEEKDLPSFLGFSASTAVWIGAQYRGGAYLWIKTLLEATLLRAQIFDQSAGDCLVFTVAGLKAANCLSEHTVLCQKDTDSDPCPEGKQLGSDGHCFSFMNTTAMTWQQARQTCQQAHNGDLAVLDKQSIRNDVIASLQVRSTSWIGLAALEMLGHYTWVNYESLNLNRNWQAGLRWPCISITSSGQLETTDCNQTLSFICEYPLNDIVTSDLLVAGTPDLQNNGSSFQTLPEYSQVLSAQVVKTVVMPGIWFAEDGLLLEVNFQALPQSAGNVLAIQVLRPTCSSGQVVIRPGCKRNMFAKCGSPAEASRCPSLPICNTGSDYVCLLRNICIQSASSCSCPSSDLTNIDCTASDPDPDMSYTLIGQAMYEVPASGGSLRAKISGVRVQANDILAFQSTDFNPGLCLVDATSQWKQVAFSTVLGGWSELNKEIFLLNYTKQEHYVCPVAVVYGNSKTVLAPVRLAFVPNVGSYTYRAEVISSRTTVKSCSVEAVQQVGSLTWLHPTLSQSTIDPFVYVKADVPQSLVVILASGTHLHVLWELGSSLSQAGSAVAACPASVPSSVAECQQPISQLTEPFLVFTDTFSSESLQSVTLNVSNPLGWKSITVVVKSISFIQNIKLVHSSCSASLACHPLVEVGVSQQFFVNKSSGTVDIYNFSINGTNLTSQQASDLTHIFQQPGVYIMTVSASNPLQTVETSLQVLAKVRANVTQLSFEPSGQESVPVGQNSTFSVRAFVARQAELTVTWLYGDGHSESTEVQTSHSVLHVNRTHEYSMAGTYFLSVSILDPFGAEEKVEKIVNVLFPITNLITSASPSIGASGNTTSFTVQVQSMTFDNPDCGNITYICNFGDGPTEEAYITSQTSLSVRHVYNINGTYNVSFTVKNEISSVANHTIVVIQTCPVKVKLSYDGPKNLSEQLTFTADAPTGSDLKYTFDFGDRSPVVVQQHSYVLYTYNASGSYNASVVVGNDVCFVFDTENVIAMDSSTLVVRRISHDLYVAINETVQFTVDVITINMQKVALEWIVGNFTAHLQGTKKFSYTFSSEGNYTVKVNLVLDGRVNRSTSTVISVQVPVSNVTVQLPNLVSFAENRPARATFSANIEYGTDVKFRWFNNSEPFSEQGFSITREISTAGRFNISVLAYNHVSQDGAWSVITVQHTVENVNITCDTCVKVKYISTGREAQLQCTHLGTNTSVIWTLGAGTTQGGKMISHVYAIAGLQLVKVSVFNLVSMQNVTFEILTEDEVSQVALTADHKVTSERSPVHLLASHYEGTHVRYTWHCGSQPARSTSTGTTVVTFPSWGLHTCTVIAANNVSNQQASVDIKVLETITFLGIKNWIARNILYVPVNKLIGVEAECNTDFEVKFTWEVWDSDAILHTDEGKELTYQFIRVMAYQLMLSVANAISFKNISVNVIALEEISNLQLIVNATKITVGTGIELTAAIDAGTNASFQWSLNSMPLLAISGFHSFPYTFNSADTYIIEVNSSNSLGFQTANITILVQYPIQHIQLHSSLDLRHPYISQNQMVDFQVNISQGSDPLFIWTVQSPLHTLNKTGNSIQLNFSEIGEYHIQLTVSNAVSQETKSFLVYVERPITSLTALVNASGVVAAGDVISFSGAANKDATMVTYIWIIEGQAFSGANFSHHFQSAGLFLIKLVAQNNISQKEESKTIEVQIPLAALQLTDCNVTRQAGVLIRLSATAQGTNISFFWVIELPMQNKTGIGANLNITFPLSGSYPIHLMAQNKLRQETLSCVIRVQDAITNLTVKIASPPVDYIFTNQNITFVVTGNNLINATYIWEFQSLHTVSTDVTELPTKIAIFAIAQRVTLEITVKNDISEKHISVNFTVQDLKCNLPVVTPVGSDSRSVLRSKSVQFDVYIDNKGCSEYVAIHKWKIYEVSDCTQELIPSNSLRITSVDLDKPTLILPISRLPATKEHFCVHYTMGYQMTPVAEDVFYNLTTLASPLVAIITGGQWRQVDGSEEVCLDGSLSYNPDRPDVGSAGMVLSWSCQLISSVGKCFPHMTNSKGKICLSNITAGTYSITLTVYLSGHINDSSGQMLEVWVTSPPILSVGVECVSCQAARDYRTSLNHHTVLSAHCVGCTTRVSYSWSVIQDNNMPVFLGPHDTSTVLDVGYTVCDIFSVYKGTKAANLVILRNTVLKNGHSYNFTVTIDSLDGSRSQSKAYITLLPNLPPSGGSCIASPDTITVLQDLVTVSCSGWVDQDDGDSELLYEIKVVHRTQSYLLYYGTRSTQAVYVAPWPGTQNSPAQLVVSVLDESGACTNALNKTIAFKIGANLSVQELYLAANTTLTTLMQQGDPVPLLQYALVLTQMLNGASTGSMPNEDLEVQASLRSVITLLVSSIAPLKTLQQAQQMAYLLNLLTEFSAEYQTSGCQTLMMRSLQDIVCVLYANVRPGLNREDFAFQSLFFSIYHLIEAVSLGSSSPSTFSTKTSFLSAFPQFVGLSPRLDSRMRSLDFDKAVTADHKAYIVSNAFVLAEDVMSVVLKSVVLDEESVTFQLRGMEVEGLRTTVGSISYYMEHGGCRFMLPNVTFSHFDSNQEVLKIMVMLDNNPFTWGYIDQLTITSRVPTLSFKYTNGSDLAVADLPGNIEVLMFNSDNRNYTITNGSLLQNPHYDPLANSVFETWTLERGLTKKLLIDGQKGSSSHSALHVQVRVEALPNKTDEQHGQLPKAVIKAYLGAGFEATSESFTDHKEITTAHMTPGTDHQLYTFFVPAEDFRTETEYSITLINEDKTHDVNISASMYLSSCQYYDEANEIWSAFGCTVSSESIPIATVCHCNHLTAFGGSSLVPISSIRFTDLANLKLGLNPVTVVAVSTLFLLYVIGLIICYRLDRADLQRISMVPLCGRDGPFKYHITVITGRRLGAGTSAHVGIKIYGDKNKSEARHLTKKSSFQRNSCDTFLVATDNDLGMLQKIHIWHDNTGPSPSWYLQQIQVLDLQNGQRYVFPANSWLSLEMEDGKLQKEIHATASEELHSFSRVFHTSLANNMAERHMWFSIFNRPDHSRFTRVQRITCCITLIYLYMFLNAMWYGLIKDQAEAAASISWNVIGWEEVVIALVSVGTIFPVALLLSCIFKRSRSKADVFKLAMRPQSAQTLEIDAMCDWSQYEGSLRTMTPNDDWSAIFERESTTESIPPISSQLRRTTAVTRSRKESSGSHSTFPGSGKKQSSVKVIQRTQDLMWTRENIFKSWPEKLPSFSQEESGKTTSKPGVSTSTTAVSASDTSSSSAATKKNNKAASLAPKSTVRKKTQIAPAKSTDSKLSVHHTRTTSGRVKKTTSLKAETENDSEEEFMQRLDEIDRELEKSASRRNKMSSKSNKSKGSGKKSLSHKSGTMEDLFDSDDDWTSENLDVKEGIKRERNAFNPRQDPSLERRASLTSLMRLRAASMHVPSSAGSSLLRRDSNFMMSEKSRTTLSAMLKSRMQILSSPVEDKGCRLPWFCVFLGYTFCLALSAISVIMVLLYGYNFGPSIAVEWLLSILLAFLISIFVLEPLKVMILTLYVATVVKDAEKDVESDSIDVLPFVEANEQLKEMKFRPLGGFALLQAQEEGRKKVRLRVMIRQTAAYLLLTATALVVANVYFGPALYQATCHVENTFVYTDATASRSASFHNISSTDVFWEWAQVVMTPALYRSDLISNEENPVLLGPVRLRQIRSTLVECMTNKTGKIRSCIGQLDFTEDTATYSKGWLSTTSGNASWTYTSPDQLDTWPKFGQSLLYSGGGYSQELGTSFNQTQDTLQQLAKARWLDRRSRALFLEWTMYSAAENLFISVTLLLEFPISGGVLTSHTIQTQQLYFFYPNKVDVLYVCQVLLLVSVIYLFIQTVITIFQQKSRFLHCPGNWLQMVSTLICLASIGLYIACVVLTTDTLDRFSSNSTSFTNFERVVHMHEILRLLHACLLFLLFLKIAGQVRYIRPLSVFPRALATAFSRLAGATLIFLILLVTYTQLGYLFYGRFLYNYHSFQNSLVTLFGVMKGSVDFSASLEYQPVFSHFFFYSFYSFVYGLFVALLIAILQDAYKFTRSQMFFKSTLEPQDHEMIEFMLKRLKLSLGLTKPKPAFRRVKFEGLPSLPSRGSSSAASSQRLVSDNSQEHSTPTPDLIASMNNGDAIDRLLPAWEKLLALLGTMEILEKEEQRQMRYVQTAFSRWSNGQDKKAKPADPKKKNSSGGLSGKPPIDPKTKSSQSRPKLQNASSDQKSDRPHQHPSITPTSSSMPSQTGKILKKGVGQTLGQQDALAFELKECSSSNSQKARPSPKSADKTAGLLANSAQHSSVSHTKCPMASGGHPATVDDDTFPGSATQRGRSTSDIVKTRSAANPADSVSEK